MKEIIENIQILFNNKEFTLVDELLKSQGLGYDVLNCSQLFKTFDIVNGYYYSYIELNDELLVAIYNDTNMSNYMIFIQDVDDVIDKTKDDYEILLSMLKMNDLIEYYISSGEKTNNYYSHLCNVTDHLMIEFIIKLNNYKQCGIQ